MKRRSPKIVKGVLIPVLIQDPAVAVETEARSITHPVVVKDSKGFSAGPACRRVAIVDLDFHTGKLRAPAELDPKARPYPNIGMYSAPIPTKKGAASMPWTRNSERGIDVGQLGFMTLDDPFMKVSVFGTVLRTLGLVQNPAVLGREIPWAFPGEQLLVVPRAGDLDNAFYHRDSRSLQFYYGATSSGQTVYSGLSQDIVAHETAHAIIDGIAPDLYDASSPESLAIHEGLADLTAGLLSMRNRELTHKPGDRRMDLKIFQQSSRFSRIAEEFGRWRGHGTSLRDICNMKTMDPKGRQDRRVDSSSPHSASEVLSGLLFQVFRSLFARMPDDPAAWRKMSKQEASNFEAMRYRVAYASDRTLGLAYRGLDWLPPGDASFADLTLAMLAADQEFFPRDAQTRKQLREEATSRGISLSDAASRSVSQVEVPLSPAAEQKFLAQHREALEIPSGADVRVTVRLTHIYEPPPIPRTTSESFDLTPDMKRWVSAKTENYLIKLAWEQHETNDLEGWGTARSYRTGATIVAAPDGRVRTVLHNRNAALSTRSRSRFLRRVLSGQRVTPMIGPDGAPLERGLRAELREGTLSITGAMQALHVAADIE
jgi:hypothetical protein